MSAYICKIVVTDMYWLFSCRVRHDDGYTYETEPNWWAKEEEDARPQDPT